MAVNILIPGCSSQSHIPTGSGLLQGLNIYCNSMWQRNGVLGLTHFVNVPNVVTLYQEL